jgi:hypothetical protein
VTTAKIPPRILAPKTIVVQTKNGKKKKFTEFSGDFAVLTLNMGHHGRVVPGIGNCRRWSGDFFVFKKWEFFSRFFFFFFSFFLSLAAHNLVFSAKIRRVESRISARNQIKYGRLAMSRSLTMRSESRRLSPE